MIYESAKKYHDAGLSLVNLHPIENGKCGCGNPECKMAGKHPQNSNWQIMIGMSNQFELIENYHNFNMLCTGFGWLLEDHHLVVDVDPKNGGFESFDKLCEKVPQLKECGVGVKTGGGGFHLYYNKPADLDVRGSMKEYPGIDFKHKGGFVVAGGSLHNSGKYYTIDHCYDDDLTNLDDAPVELLAIIEKVICESDFESDFDGDLTEVVAHIPNNDDHYDDFIEIGMAIHDTDPNAYPLWEAWASKSSKFDEAEMLVKWESFGKNPSRVTIATLIKKALENGYKLPARGGTEVIIPADHTPEDELCTDHIDVLNPHGLVGDIVRYMNETAYRDRPSIAVGAALWSVSSAMNRMYLTPDGAKVSIIVMGIAASGSGKDNPYQVAKSLLIKAGYGCALYPEMASDKDMIKSIIDHQCAFYAIDEAHKIFGAMQNKNANSYLQQIEGAILNLSTERLLTLRAKEVEPLRAHIDKSIAILEKQKEDVEIGKEFIIENKIQWLKNKESYLSGGITNPFMNLYATSTPGKLDGMVSEDTLSSGLMGRTLLVREFEDFPKAKAYGFGAIKRHSIPESIHGRFNNIVQRGRAQDKTMTYREDYGLEFWGEPIVMTASDSAIELSKKIGAWFDSRAQKSNPIMQPVWARAFQMTSVIASIMAAETSIITEEDLMYAFALIKSDINTKTGMCLQAMADNKDADNEERGDALAARLVQICDVQDGLSPSVIKKKTKKFSESDVKTSLNKLVELGAISRVESDWSGRKSVKFKTIKNNFI
jgi:hypothetical protein